MNRDLLIRILVMGLLLAGAAWVVTSTEWAEVQVEKPPRGAAATDRFFATEQLLRQLGARVERRQALEPLPPPGARLVLSSQHWQLFPERTLQLRRWIEAGGHLVVPATLLGQRDVAAWMPLVLHDKEKREPARQRKPDPADRDQHCRHLAVPATLAAEAVTGMRLCAAPYWRALRPRAGAGEPLWLLEGAEGSGISL